MLKKAQVIMLSTDNENQGIYLSPVPSINKIHYWNKRISNSYIAQHLYIISDDEIKAGDWCVITTGDIQQIKQVEIVENITITFKDNSFYSSLSCKKIIATTDTSLRVYEPCIQCDGTGETTFSGTHTTQKKCDLCSQLKYPNAKLLPQPSQQFIEKYIEEYNKGEIITDVLVEYEGIKIKVGQYSYLDDSQLKINSKDNTITIKKLKETWNKEKVIDILHKYGLNLIDQIENKSLEEQVDINQWIKENL